MDKHRWRPADLQTTSSSAGLTMTGQRPGSGAGFRRPVVLVVAQGPLSLLVLNLALVDGNFDVIPAGSLEDGLGKVTSGQDCLDAVIINLREPESSRGSMLLARLARERWPGVALLVSLDGAGLLPPDAPEGTISVPRPIVLDDLVLQLSVLLAPWAEPASDTRHRSCLLLN